MDVIFCNDFADNLPLMTEFQTSTMLRNPVPYIVNSVMILSIVFFMFFTSDITKAICIFLFLLLILVYNSELVWRVKRFSKQTIDREKELNNGSPSSARMEVTYDTLRCKSYNGAFTEVPLYNMKKAYETKHLVVIESKTANLYYLFKKDSFTKGTYPEFMEFLKQKGLYK